MKLKDFYYKFETFWQSMYEKIGRHVTIAGRIVIKSITLVLPHFYVAIKLINECPDHNNRIV